MHARCIPLKTEAAVKSVAAELDKVADFAALAEGYSADPAPARGGGLGYFGRDDSDEVRRELAQLVARDAVDAKTQGAAQRRKRGLRARQQTTADGTPVVAR